MDDFDPNDRFQYPLPDWAEAYNRDQAHIRGAQLLTKNSRRTGNAVIVSVDWDSQLGYLFTCRTDAGNQARYTLRELQAQFELGDYLIKESELTARKEVIHSCRTCRYRDHKGAFGNPSCIPCCRHPAARREDGMSPELPYTPTISGNRIHATASEVIPDWCPLERNR